jgi:uncharacterized protein YyaL (SSP411 family)
MSARRPNRLIHELSPYLQQHAHNPVDWYAWGDEALTRARDEDKPILLSIGYSACHWCHVMERESFDDEETAALMNQLFVCVKVDREERPDLDQIYQLVVQLMRRGGGWPLTVFLTPARKPFFGGTYFPPVERYGMPSFRTVLRAVADAYAERRDEVERSAEQLTRAIGELTSSRADPTEPPTDVATRAAARLVSRFDERHGGFGERPKFPNTMSLDVMLRASMRGARGMLERVQKALDAMRDGGIRDHLGGGFHRYSTDERWLVPHFEKMLYDNALLARLYVDGWRATGEARYAETARDTLRYLDREMRSPEGLFYAAQDADSEGEEGRFFVWRPEELEAVLGPEVARVAALAYGVSAEGNFEHTGASVLHASRTPAAVAARLGLEEAEVRTTLDRAREALFDARERRPKPFRDEKIIATWNGLTIGAFAAAGAALGEARWVETAVRALDALRRTLWRDRRLLRIAKDGAARVDGFLEDYADVANAALDVHEATLDRAWLAFADELVRAALARFHDDEHGGFFFATESDDRLVRAKDSHDNAVPSGTSSMLWALLRVHAYTGGPELLEVAERTARGLAGPAMESPFGHGRLLCALDRYVHGPVEVVVVAEPGDIDADMLLGAARRAFVPDLVLVRVEPGSAMGTGAGGAVERRTVDGRATAYVCHDRTCSPPVTSPDALYALLQPRRP